MTSDPTVIDLEAQRAARTRHPAVAAGGLHPSSQTTPASAPTPAPHTTANATATRARVT